MFAGGRVDDDGATVVLNVPLPEAARGKVVGLVVFSPPWDDAAEMEDEAAWKVLAMQSFFAGDDPADAIYDTMR